MPTPCAEQRPPVSTVSRWLALVVDVDQRLRDELEQLAAARRALSRRHVARLEQFLRDEVPPALHALDELERVDEPTLRSAMASWTSTPVRLGQS